MNPHACLRGNASRGSAFLVGLAVFSIGCSASTPSVPSKTVASSNESSTNGTEPNDLGSRLSSEDYTPGPRKVIFGYDGPLADGAPTPWKIMVKTGTPQLRVVVHQGTAVLYMLSDKSSFSLNREVDMDVTALRHVAWKWQVQHLPHGKSKDEEKDQALQVFLSFQGGDTLNYNWETNRPVGSVFDERILWFHLKSLSG